MFTLPVRTIGERRMRFELLKVSRPVISEFALTATTRVSTHVCKSRLVRRLQFVLPLVTSGSSEPRYVKSDSGGFVSLCFRRWQVVVFPCGLRSLSSGTSRPDLCRSPQPIVVDD